MREEAISVATAAVRSEFPKTSRGVPVRMFVEVAFDSIEHSSSEESLSVARNIVNGLYELAELSVPHRQLLNDEADEFVVRCLEKLR